jgi:protein-S-isoprenylcysteine O-methyltransferase
MAEPHADVQVHSDILEQRIREREHLRSRPLETIPDTTVSQPHGTLPNTPLTVSTISFLLGAIFSLGFSVFLYGDLSSFWFATYQLAFFVASWSAFHWGEFAVTAGWNREKVSVDCTYLLSWSLDKRT